MRKIVHVMGILYIPMYNLLGRSLTFIVVMALTLAATAINALGIVPKDMLRSYEVDGISGYLSFGISAMLITLLLPKNACFVAISVSAIGDCVSGILKHVIGFGRNPASVAMLVSSLLAVAVMGLLNFKALVAIAVGVIVERISIRLDDNLTVPIAVGTTYALLSHIL